MIFNRKIMTSYRQDFFVPADFSYRQICNLPEYKKTTGLQIRLFDKDSVVRRRNVSTVSRQNKYFFLDSLNICETVFLTIS